MRVCHVWHARICTLVGCPLLVIGDIVDDAQCPAYVEKWVFVLGLCSWGVVQPLLPFPVPLSCGSHPIQGLFFLRQFPFVWTVTPELSCICIIRPKPSCDYRLAVTASPLFIFTINLLNPSLSSFIFLTPFSAVVVSCPDLLSDWNALPSSVVEHHAVTVLLLSCLLFTLLSWKSFTLSSWMSCFLPLLSWKNLLSGSRFSRHRHCRLSAMFTFLYVSIDLNIYNVCLNIYNVCITYLYSGHFMPHTVAILSQYLYFSRCKVTVVCAHRQENKCFSAVCRLIFDLCQRIVCVHTNILCLLPCMTVRCGCPHGSPCAFALRPWRAWCEVLNPIRSLGRYDDNGFYIFEQMSFLLWGRNGDPL